MTRSNRFFNRGLLALLGLVLIAGAAWTANRAFPDFADGLGINLGPVIEPKTIGAPSVAGFWIAAAAMLVVVALAAVVIFSRGRGQTRTVITRSDGAGAASIETRVVSDLVSEDLARVPDVVSVSASAFDVRRETALELRVTTRSAADVRLVIDSVERAVAQLDEVLETRIPVLLHVASGVRAGFARQQRVR